MDDLMGFLRARRAEDKALADAVCFACRDSREPWPPEQAPGKGGPVLTEFLCHFSEYRALRAIAASAAIIGEQTSDHAPVETDYGLTCRTCVSWQDDDGMTHEFGIAIPAQWPCRVARAAVAPYAGHPDYRPEWKL